MKSSLLNKTIKKFVTYYGCCRSLNGATHSVFQGWFK